MKTYIHLLFVLWPVLSFSQTEASNVQDQLPEEILTFYTDTNLINILTTSAEKSKMVSFLERGEIQHAPSSKREFYVVELLKHVVGKEVRNSAAMPNSIGQQNQNLSRDIYDIQNWQESDGCIYVSLHASSISEEDNIKMIKLFDEGKFDQEFKSLATFNLKAKEIHKWIFRDNQWYKNEVRVVLTR
jgi:hypothetical protein